MISLTAGGDGVLADEDGAGLGSRALLRVLGGSRLIIPAGLTARLHGAALRAAPPERGWAINETELFPEIRDRAIPRNFHK